ncbi:MAG: hypothetical protein ACYTFY_04660 [Planctomycetota bacterium]
MNKTQYLKDIKEACSELKRFNSSGMDRVDLFSFLKQINKIKYRDELSGTKGQDTGIYDINSVKDIVHACECLTNTLNTIDTLESMDFNSTLKDLALSQYRIKEREWRRDIPLLLSNLVLPETPEFTTESEGSGPQIESGTLENAASKLQVKILKLSHKAFKVLEFDEFEFFYEETAKLEAIFGIEENLKIDIFKSHAECLSLISFLDPALAAGQTLENIENLCDSNELNGSKDLIKELKTIYQNKLQAAKKKFTAKS